MTQTSWDWPITDTQRSHSARATLLRSIPYETTLRGEAPAESTHSGQLLSLNISNGGMLVLMDQPPAVEQVLKVHIPTPVNMAEIPTLAEVRWTKPLPFGKSNGDGAFFVGLKFLF